MITTRYNKFVDFYEWIQQKFIDWSKGEKSVNQFAAYLEISQPTVNAWFNKTRGVPRTREIIDKLIAKFGYEVYDILAIPHPPEAEIDRYLAPIARSILQFPPEVRPVVREALHLALQELLASPQPPTHDLVVGAFVRNLQKKLKELDYPGLADTE